MKFLKVGIRVWITLISTSSFLAGWIMLAHAPKPDQARSIYTQLAAPLPTLEPLHPLSNFDEDQLEHQPLFSEQPSSPSQFRPIFRTGGS